MLEQTYTSPASPTALVGNTKRMKRLHQLCEETARKAINELRLMHRRFSMPHHLLKFDYMTPSLRASLGHVRTSAPSAQRDLFWSFTLADMAVADLFVRAPESDESTVNLNKSTLLQRGKSALAKEALNDVAEKQPSASVACASVETQFFSIGKADTFAKSANVAYFDVQTNNDDFSWKNVEKCFQVL